MSRGRPSVAEALRAHASVICLQHPSLPPHSAAEQVSLPLRPLSGLQEIRVVVREESPVLCFPSRRGLTPRGSLECDPDWEALGEAACPTSQAPKILWLTSLCSWQ